MAGSDDDNTMYSLLLFRCLLRHSSRRVLVMLISIAAFAVPFLLLRMRSETPIVGGSQYPMLPEEMQEGIINAFRIEEEQAKRQMVRKVLSVRMRGRRYLYELPSVSVDPCLHIFQGL